VAPPPARRPLIAGDKLKHRLDEGKNVLIPTVFLLRHARAVSARISGLRNL
jgi:hypothetical protein